MYWYKLLPDSLTVVETWLKKFFVFLALITIGPWILILLYDLFLYIWRSATYELPVIGGRARGKARPRAPSLVERPGGRKRTLGVMDMPDIALAASRSFTEDAAASSTGTGQSREREGDSERENAFRRRRG